MPGSLHPAIAVRRQRIIDLARRHGLRRLCLVGSLARGDDRPDSDADFLFRLPDGLHSLGTRQFEIEDQLAEVIGRKVEMMGEHMLQPWWEHIFSQDMAVIYDDAA